MSRRTSGGTGLFGGDSESLPLPDEPLLLDGDKAALLGGGGGLAVRLLALPSSSNATEATRFPKELRLDVGWTEAKVKR